MADVATERYPIQNPTVTEAPLPSEIEAPRVPCGYCLHWHRSARSSFGQCLKAQRSLGATLYRTDLDSCSMGEMAKL